MKYICQLLSCHSFIFAIWVTLGLRSWNIALLFRSMGDLMLAELKYRFVFFAAWVTLGLRSRNIALLFRDMGDLGLAELKYRFTFLRHGWPYACGAEISLCFFRGMRDLLLSKKNFPVRRATQGARCAPCLQLCIYRMLFFNLYQY